MPRYVALLRAVNVGGTGKLPMQTLRALCESLGFARVQTYIASGNVVFDARAREEKVKRALEGALEAHAGKRIGVAIRTAAELAAVRASNPFPQALPKACLAIFLDAPPLPNALDDLRHHQGERVALGVREIYVDYGERIGDSKLVIPAAKTGTARNMNTVAALARLAAD